MTDTPKSRQRLPDADEPEDLDPGALPVEPDEGLIAPHITDDEERARLVDPEEYGSGDIAWG